MRDDTVVQSKKVESIEMLFGLSTWVGSRKHVLHRAAHWRNLSNTIEPSMFYGPAKTDEPIEIPFGL